MVSFSYIVILKYTITYVDVCKDTHIFIQCFFGGRFRWQICSSASLVAAEVSPVYVL